MELILLKIIKNIIKVFKLRLFAAFFVLWMWRCGGDEWAIYAHVLDGVGDS